MAKFSEDPVYSTLEFVADTIPSFFVKVYDLTRGFFGSEMHSSRAELIDLGADPQKRYKSLQANFDDKMAELLPNYKSYRPNEVSFSVKLAQSEAADLAEKLGSYTGFENVGIQQDGSTKFIMRINHVHDDFHGVAADLAKALNTVRDNSGDIQLLLEYANCLEKIEAPTYKDVTSPADFNALSAAEKDGATVAEKPKGPPGQQA